jgi:phosphoglucosamine mutase
MGKYFGTDGIRGIANETLDTALAFAAGRAAGTALAAEKKGHGYGAEKPRVLICKDTRVSSDMLEAALTSGLCSSGADVSPLGVLPTPAAAYLTRATGADMAVVISASHNPYEHNGVKFFDSFGFKISDEFEGEIERLIDRPEETAKMTRGAIGRVLADCGAGLTRYVDYLVSLVGGSMKRLRVAVDCANGAAVYSARQLFTRLPLDCVLIADKPDGVNINECCGSTHIEGLQKLVAEGGFDVGLAFDGDADRCLAVDESGEIIDGDMIVAICARAMKESGRLRNSAVVGTVMTNSGIIEYMGTHGIGFFSADVGDRNVLEVMRSRGCVLGGESSGHTIFLDDATTGDGQLTALRFLEVLSESGAAASELRGEIPVYPQVLQNAAVDGDNAAKAALASDKRIEEAVGAARRRLTGGGRILVRPSGTEPLIRVSVEAKNVEIANEIARSLIDLIKSL